jgi:putative endonuclease
VDKRHCYWVYILTNHNHRVLYIGVTGDLARRIAEHKNGLVPGFTTRYKVTKLVYVEKFQYVDNALDRETDLKRWKREWKIQLIEKFNPGWDELNVTNLV